MRTTRLCSQLLQVYLCLCPVLLFLLRGLLVLLWRLVLVLWWLLLLLGLILVLWRLLLLLGLVLVLLLVDRRLFSVIFFLFDIDFLAARSCTEDHNKC
jgi:hypothetical protein